MCRTDRNSPPCFRREHRILCLCTFFVENRAFFFLSSPTLLLELFFALRIFFALVSRLFFASWAIGSNSKCVFAVALGGFTSR